MTKSIIKRVIAGVLIAVILGVINSCEVKAAQYIGPSICAFDSSFQQYPCETLNTTVGQFKGLNLVNGRSNLFQFVYNYTSSDKNYVSGLIYLDYAPLPYQSGTEMITLPVVYFNNSSCDITRTGTQYDNSSGTYTRIGALYSYSCSYVDVISGVNNYLSIRTDQNLQGAFATQIAITKMYDTTDQSGIENRLDNIWQQQSWTNTQLQQNNQAVNNVNDSINDDNVDSPSSAISDNSNKVATNGVISDLITLPITLFQNILNAISGTCQSFELGTLFNYNLVMPCINLQNILGSTIYTIIDIICSGFFVYFTGRKMIDIFNNLSQLKEGDLLK